MSPGRASPKITDADVERVIVKTLEEKPDNATHWSTRSMGAATGLNQTAISRIWRAFDLRPHLSESFKLSPDPQFIDNQPGGPAETRQISQDHLVAILDLRPATTAVTPRPFPALLDMHHDRRVRTVGRPQHCSLQASPPTAAHMRVGSVSPGALQDRRR